MPPQYSQYLFRRPEQGDSHQIDAVFMPPACVITPPSPGISSNTLLSPLFEYGRGYGEVPKDGKEKNIGGGLDALRTTKKNWYGRCERWFRGCVGSGSLRAWPCMDVPDQPRRRGHYACAYFNIHVLVHRCLHEIKRSRAPRYLPHHHARSEKRPVTRKGQSDPTNSCLGCHYT